MTRINTNVASVRGLRNLQKSNDLLSTSLTRLSTGLKINSGKDNPSGLIASERLRLQVSTIEQSISNSNRANNVISTADAALGEIGGLLNQVRGLVQEGINSGALSSEETEANQQQIDAALSAINRIASNTSFAGDKLLDGSKAFVTDVSTTDAAKLSDLKINGALLGSSGSLSLEAEVTQRAEKAALQYAGGDLSGTTTLEVSGSGGQEVLFLGASSSVANIRDAVNGVSESTGVEARVLDGYRQSSDATRSTVSIGAANAEVEFTRQDAGAESTLGTTVEVAYVVSGNNTPLSIATATSGDTTTITVNVATDGAGAATSTSDDVIAAINGDSTASALVFAGRGDGDGTGTVGALTAQALTGGNDASELLLSDIRTDRSAGDLTVNFNSSGIANNTVDITLSGTDLTITSGTTATLSDVVTALGNSTDASALVQSAVTGDGTKLVEATTAAQTLAQPGDNAVLTKTIGAGTISYTDARTDKSAGDLTIAVESSGVADNAVSFEVSGTDITIKAGTTATLADVKTAIDNDSTVSELLTVATSGTTSENIVENPGPTASTLSIGAGNAEVLFTRDDLGSNAELGTTINIEFVDPAANSQALAVSTATSGTTTTITVSLATDGAGAITSTSAQIQSAINGDATASALVTASNGDGDGTGTAAAATSASLDGGADAVVIRESLFETGGNNLVFESSEFGDDQFVDVNVLNGTFSTTGLGNTTATDRNVGQDIGVNINGQAAYGDGLSAALRTGSIDAELSFQSTSNQVGQSLEVNITGGGSVFQIGEEVSAAGQVGLGIEAVNTARLGGISGKLYELGTGNGKSLLDVGSGGVTGADLVNIIDESLDRVSSLRGRLGSVQKNVIETNINTLGVALENISEARSQITDTDFATETANLTRAQILNQSGISVLAIANQNPQQVLSLLG